MTSLEKKLKELNPNLFGKFNETKDEVRLLLNQYIKNFPDYTDHSIHHTEKVFEIVSEVLTPEEINNLNDDEIYILSMASYLHDIGMCIPEDKIKEIADTDELLKERQLHPNVSREKYLRDIHHTLSKKFILEEWESLKIPSEKYAEAIGLVSEGHRIVDIGNPEIFKPKFTVKSGRQFVCLPYLSAILRIADELDITNVRTPSLLTKYYMPDNDKSLIEWNKHIANTLMFISENFVKFEVKCSNHSMLAALEDQFNKIGNVINYCQKVIRNISNTEDRKFSLKLEQVQNEYKYIDFDPKGIKYSFDVDNVINAFVGENLYNDKLTSLRELLQNSIDTCRYKKVLNPDYIPEIKLTISKSSIKIEDNGLGMDEFIIKNYFGKLCSSFYQQESVKKDFDAIGQFGVGVFSYFLMADYIDIETKTEKDATLHFRLDQDPKNYFHFFKTSTRKLAGTTITLNLKQEYASYNDVNYVEYVKDKFRYIEFPILISYQENEFELISLEFEDKKLKEDLANNLLHQHKIYSNEIEVFTGNFSNQNYEGSISFAYLKDLSFKNVGYLLNDKIHRFNGYRNHYRSILNICQKGVLISKGNDFINLSDFYCNLNLKEKIDIQISRNAFANNSKVEEIIYQVASDLIYNFFSILLERYNPKEFTKITYDFLESNNTFKFKKDLYAKFFFNFNNRNNDYSYITLEKFLKKDLKSFVISLNEKNTVFLNSKKYNFDIIELYVNNFTVYSSAYNTILHLFNSNNYKIVLIKKDDFFYVELNKDAKIIEKMNFMPISIGFTNCINITSIIVDEAGILNSFIDDYSYEGSDLSINYNHPFIQEIFSNNEYDLSQKAKDLLNEILLILSHTYLNDDFVEGNLTIINELLILLQESVVINYQLSAKDFQLKY